jgi:hypothetical protein
LSPRHSLDEKMLKPQTRHLLRIGMYAVISITLAVPIGGFVYGFQVCADCGRNVNRAFMGIINAIIVPIGFGFGWPDEYGHRDNVWPYITAVALCILFILCVTDRVLARRRERRRTGSAAHCSADS